MSIIKPSGTKGDFFCFSSCLTHALALIVLVNKNMVQDKVEQLILQSAVWVEDERLETFSASRSQLVAEDHQQVTEQHERLGTEQEEFHRESISCGPWLQKELVLTLASVGQPQLFST